MVIHTRFAFYAPQGQLVFVLSVSNISHNFWTVRDRDFIVLHAHSTNKTLSYDTRANGLVTLTVTFILKMTNLDFVVMWMQLYSQSSPVVLYMPRPCMVNRSWGIKKLTLQVNGHAWYHLHGLPKAMKNGKQAKNAKWKCLHRESNQQPLAFPSWHCRRFGHPYSRHGMV